MSKFGIFILLYLLFSCNKEGHRGEYVCTGKGKHNAILIRKGCESYVFQILNPAIAVQKDWTDIFSKNKYTDVVSILNYCDGSAESKVLEALNVGDHVTFDVSNTTDRCLILCFAFEDSPAPAYKASTIEKCSQEN